MKAHAERSAGPPPEDRGAVSRTSEAALHAEADLLIEAALREDVGEGDFTTLWTVGPEDRAEAAIVAKGQLVMAGCWVARRIFSRAVPGARVEALVHDGVEVRPGTELLRVRGATRGILTAERTVLNFLGRLSGIATLTRRFVEAVAGTPARITDTRKTTPGWRLLEKWAVRMGGGVNHRNGLDDMILIKDNHIAATGGARAAVLSVQARNGRGLEVEVEVSSAVEIEALRGLPIQRVLLDNMGEDELRAAVSRVSGWPESRPELEASGNISLERVPRVAGTGVEWISVGALTHSAPAADLSLRVLPAPPGPEG